MLNPTTSCFKRQHASNRELLRLVHFHARQAHSLQNTSQYIQSSFCRLALAGSVSQVDMRSPDARVRITIASNARAAKRADGPLLCDLAHPSSALPSMQQDDGSHTAFLSLDSSGHARLDMCSSQLENLGRPKTKRARLSIDSSVFPSQDLLPTGVDDSKMVSSPFHSERLLQRSLPPPPSHLLLSHSNPATPPPPLLCSSQPTPSTSPLECITSPMMAFQIVTVDDARGMLPQLASIRTQPSEPGSESVGAPTSHADGTSEESLPQESTVIITPAGSKAALPWCQANEQASGSDSSSEGGQLEKWLEERSTPATATCTPDCRNTQTLNGSNPFGESQMYVTTPPTYTGTVEWSTGESELDTTSVTSLQPLIMHAESPPCLPTPNLAPMHSSKCPAIVRLPHAGRAHRSSPSRHTSPDRLQILSASQGGGVVSSTASPGTPASSAHRPSAAELSPKARAARSPSHGDVVSLGSMHGAAALCNSSSIACSSTSQLQYAKRGFLHSTLDAMCAELHHGTPATMARPASSLEQTHLKSAVLSSCQSGECHPTMQTTGSVHSNADAVSGSASMLLPCQTGLPPKTPPQGAASHPRPLNPIPRDPSDSFMWARHACSEMSAARGTPSLRNAFHVALATPPTGGIAGGTVQSIVASSRCCTMSDGDSLVASVVDPSEISPSARMRIARAQQAGQELELGRPCILGTAQSNRINVTSSAAKQPSSGSFSSEELEVGSGGVSGLMLRGHSTVYLLEAHGATSHDPLTPIVPRSIDRHVYMSPMASLDTGCGDACGSEGGVLGNVCTLLSTPPTNGGARQGEVECSSVSLTSGVQMSRGGIGSMLVASTAEANRIGVVRVWTPSILWHSGTAVLLCEMSVVVPGAHLEDIDTSKSVSCQHALPLNCQTRSQQPTLPILAYII
jgi:hypothetical protein